MEDGDCRWRRPMIQTLPPSLQVGFRCANPVDESLLISTRDNTGFYWLNLTTWEGSVRLSSSLPAHTMGPCKKSHHHYRHRRQHWSELTIHKSVALQNSKTPAQCLQPGLKRGIRGWGGRGDDKQCHRLVPCPLTHQIKVTQHQNHNYRRNHAHTHAHTLRQIVRAY